MSFPPSSLLFCPKGRLTNNRIHLYSECKREKQQKTKSRKLDIFNQNFRLSVVTVASSASSAGACQVLKRKKDVGETRTRPGGKRVRIRLPNLNDKKVKSHSLLTQVLDKGRFLRLGESTILTPGRSMELRCKGGHIGWSYPTYLDTFNDSRLRCCWETPAVSRREAAQGFVSSSFAFCL